MPAAAATPLPIAPDHPVFAGHFPGQPLLPGVLLLARLMEEALARPEYAALLGSTPRIAAVKFLAPVRPGDTPLLRWQADASRLRFDVHCGERLAASGQFEPCVAAPVPTGLSPASAPSPTSS